MWFSKSNENENEAVAVVEQPNRDKEIFDLTNQTGEALTNLHSLQGLPPLQISEPEKIRLAAFDNIYMPQQKAAFTFELRCRMMEQLGFRKFSTSEEALEFFIGEKVNSRTERPGNTYQSYPYSWFYDHRNEQKYECGYAGIRDELGNSVRWYMQRYGWHTRKGLFVLGPVDCLKQAVPTGVLLSMADMKEHNLVNCFHAIAPIEAWKPGEAIDPIVFGTVFELPSEHPQSDKGQEAHFFIAKW